MEEKLELLKILADKTRIEILNILLKEDSYVEKIACELSLTPATICYHLKKMEAAGVVHCSRTQYYIIYSINREIFDKPLSEIIQKEDGAVDREEKYKKWERKECYPDITFLPDIASLLHCNVNDLFV